MPRTYAAELMDEPGFAGRAGGAVARLVPARRSDVFMLLIAVAASATVLVNALALQGGRQVLPHMLPGGLKGLIGDAVPLPMPAPPEARQAAPTPPPAPQPHEAAAPQPAAAPLPTPKPAAAALAKPAAPKPPAAIKPTAAKPADLKPVDLAPPAAIPASQPARSGIGGLSAEITGSVRPPGDVLSPRLLAVQKALANIGYGPIRIDGRDGAATREAIQRFERDRRLPVSGQVSDRLVRELNAVAGTSIE